MYIFFHQRSKESNLAVASDLDVLLLQFFLEEFVNVDTETSECKLQLDAATNEVEVHLRLRFVFVCCHVHCGFGLLDGRVAQLLTFDTDRLGALFLIFLPRFVQRVLKFRVEWLLIIITFFLAHVF